MRIQVTHDSDVEVAGQKGDASLGAHDVAMTAKIASWITTGICREQHAHHYRVDWRDELMSRVG
ncbi:hypothetical protein N9053_02680 [bacterium]|nr:hypothetical protein [bacterium]